MQHIMQVMMTLSFGTFCTRFILNFMDSTGKKVYESLQALGCDMLERTV